LGVVVSAPVTTAFRGGHKGEPGWWFAFEFDEPTIEALKAEIPAECRSYDEETHRWWVCIEWVDVAIVILPGLEAYTRQEPLL
jgi:hypothetical protein